MNLTDEIHYYTDPDVIGIWWEKPDGADQIDGYELRLDGALFGVTKKTHFTFEDLESEREYTVQVTAKNAEGMLVDDVALRIKTPAQRKTIVVTDAPYGAVGDSVTKNTEAIQRAIDDCPEGGAVVVPEGTFLTGALRLHGDMELYISEGAVLLGSVEKSDYLPLIPGRVNGTETECYAGLLNVGTMDHCAGTSCRNVIIRGKGTIKGGGEELARVEKEDGSDSAALVNICNCGDVRISSLTLADGPDCLVHMIYSLNILTDHCIFRSGSVNEGDGWIPDSTESCAIYACTFFTGGSSIAIESGAYPEGNEIARPSRKIRIFDCRSMSGSGLAIGSQMSGGIENICIWDCDLERSTCGIQITGTKNNGGYVRGLRVEDCVTSRLRVIPTGPDERRVPGAGVPDLGNLLYERVLITGRSLRNGDWRECRSVEIEGFDKGHPIRNVLLRDVDIKGGLGVYTEYCDKLIFESEGDEN